MARYIIVKLFLIALSLVFYSCVNIHNGSSTSNLPFSPKDKWVDTPMVKVKNLRFFGLGKRTKLDLYSNAKKKLYKTYNLKEGQYFLNFTSDKNQFFIFGFVFVVNKLTLQADVYSTNQSEISINENLRKISHLDSMTNNSKLNNGSISNVNNQSSKSEVIIGTDTLVLNENYISFNNDSKKDLVLVSVNGKVLTFAEKFNSYSTFNMVSVDNIYRVKGTLNNYTVGEVVKTKIYAVYEKATIVGINPRRLLLKFGSGYFAKEFNQVKGIE
jgi:hypothetical protein